MMREGWWNRDDRCFMLLIVGVLICLLSGCGPTKLDTGDIEVRQAAPEQPQPQEIRVHRVTEEDLTDYGSERGVFRIIPPAVINPKNLQYAADPQIITIDFQQGFDGVSAQILYQGRVIFNERLFSNRDGFADSVNLRYDEAPVKVGLRIPAMGIEETFTIDPDMGRFLGIAFQRGELMLKLQETTFFYPPLKAGVVRESVR